MRIPVRRFALTAAALALVLGTTGRVDAASVTIISNLAGSTDNASLAISGANSVAAGFTMPAGSDYPLDSVDLRLSFPTAAGIPSVAIYDNQFSGQQNEPGKLLVTLNNPSISIGSSPNDYLFSSPTPFSLQAVASSSIYWVVVGIGTSSSGSFNWYGSAPGTPVTGIARSAGYLVGAPPPTTVFTMFTPSFGVNAVSIPEPSSIGMLVIGIGGVMCLIKRRRIYRSSVGTGASSAAA